MYYCQPCADKANMPSGFFQTIYACDCCGEFAVVYDNAKVPSLPKDAPTFTRPGPRIIMDETKPNRRHGTLKPVAAAVLVVLATAFCGCSKPSQASSTPRWKVRFDSQTWSVAHWTASGYASWSLDWCDGFAADDSHSGKLVPICFTGPRSKPTGWKVGRRWVPRYWHSAYSFYGVLNAEHDIVATNAVLVGLSVTNSVPVKPFYFPGAPGMMDPYDNQFYPHPKPRVLLEDK